jgi:uncharacterized surface protein with fasciclin (FAS1) repeats
VNVFRRSSIWMVFDVRLLIHAVHADVSKYAGQLDRMRKAQSLRSPPYDPPGVCFGESLAARCWPRQCCFRGTYFGVFSLYVATLRHSSLSFSPSHPRMRLSGCIPLTLLALVSLSTAAQVPWHSDVTIQSKTLVDVLGDDEDYSLLLGLLQRAKLIPTLNKLNNSTLFAPTNDAIKRHAQTNELWRLTLSYHDSPKDNVQEELRQQLLYHMLNYSLTQIPKDSTTKVLHTLHFPKPSLDPPTNEPPPSPPWMPIPESTLGNEPQRLRLTSREDVHWVGVDAFGKGGIEVIKKRADATNGVVYGIADVLEVPPHLGLIFLLVALHHNPLHISIRTRPF